MWCCQHCQETVEDSFDLCWKCGTSRQGDLDPAFLPEPDDPAVPDPALDASEVPAAPPIDVRAGGVSGSGMDRREIATLICRTLALLMFGQAAIYGFTSALLSGISLLRMRYDTDWDQLYAYLVLGIPFVVILSVGVLYWRKSGIVACWMASDDPRPVVSCRITVSDLMVVAFTTAGVVILLDAVRTFLPMAYLAFRYTYSEGDFWRNTGTWSALIQGALALWLILGSTGIVRAVCWLRTAGIADASQQPTERDAT